MRNELHETSARELLTELARRLRATRTGVSSVIESRDAVAKEIEALLDDKHPKQPDWEYALENIETNCRDAAEVLRSRSQSTDRDDVYRVALALELVGKIIRPLVDRIETLEKREGEP
jgi:uncharacterized membrane protein YccC